MATVQRFEGPSLDDVLAQVRFALGDDAEIIEANRIKASGVIGSDRYEVKARRAQKGQRRADRQATAAHVNPTSGGAGRTESYPGGLDDATVQAAMDHVQQVMADLERKRIAQNHADVPSPTSLVDLADQVVDDSPQPAFNHPQLGDDPSFAALLAEARANAKANAPKIPMEWPELEAMSGTEAAGDKREDGTVEWEPLDWSARRVRAADPEPMDSSTMLDIDEADDDIPDEVEDDFGPALMGEDEDVNDTEDLTSDYSDVASSFTEGQDDDPTCDEPSFADPVDECDDVAIVAQVEQTSLSTSLFADIETDTQETETDTAPAQDALENETATDGTDQGSVEVVEEKTLTGEANAVQSTDSDAPIEHKPKDPAPAVEPVDHSAPPFECAETDRDALPADELDESTQTGWVDADREFMGVWTDEAEHEDAGWFATDEPDNEVQEFATLRNHRLVEWLSRNDLTPEALNQALEGLPRPDDLPPGPGVIIAVVGDGPLVLPLARRIAVDLDADPAKVVLASELRSHASVPDNCRISNADEAALDRRAWRRRSSATLVAVDTSTSLAANAQDWACQVLESLQPHQVIALVDAGRKAEDVARWIADLGGIDAIALSGLEETVSPHAILELGIPVARLGTQVATPRAWSALLRNRREPVE